MARRAREQGSWPQRIGLAALLGAALGLEVLYAANMVAWRNAPDRGWVGLAETGPHVIAATRPEGEEAGLRAGDRILAINGESYGSYREMLGRLRLELGTSNLYTIQRGAETLEIPVPTNPIGLRIVLLQSGTNLALGLAFLVMGVLVFLMKPWSSSSWAFLLLATAFGLTFPYTRCTYLFQPGWLNEVYPVAACFVGATALHLAAVFPQRRRVADRRGALIVPYALAALLAGYSVTLGDWQDVGGWASTIWYFFPLAGLLVFLASTIATWLRSDSVVARLQAMVVFTGTLIAFIVPLVELVYARLFGIHLFPNVLYSWMPFVVAFPFSIAYSIVRHDLFEIDVFVRRTYGYLASTGAILLLYGATVSALNLTIGPSEITRSPLFSVAFVLAVVFLMQPLQGRLQALVDRAFYREKADYRATISAATERMTSLLEPELIRERLVTTVVDGMFLENAYLLDAERGSEGFTMRNAGGAPWPRERSRELKLDPGLRAALAANREGVFRHEIELDPAWASRRDGVRSSFDELDAELMLPMLYQGQLRAVLSLGVKKSGQMFTREDVDLLRTLLAQSAIALENARLFDDLADSLKQVHMLQTIKTSLAKFVPRTVQRLLESRPDAEGLFDKRECDLSVVFADMTGYTRMSAQLPLDEVNAIVERYFGAFLDVILSHGGDVNETAGDGLMVLFMDDDPESHARAAVSAALEIQRVTREINERRTGELPIGMHIGVNSGIASVGATKIEGGAGMRWTYTASGPTTNVAARMAALGQDIAVTDATRERLGDAFTLESLGPQTLKNVSHPVEAYRVLARTR